MSPQPQSLSFLLATRHSPLATSLAMPTNTPVPGTRPEGATTEADASRKVREMFSQIAPRYDFLNHFLSAEIDRTWRKRAARQLRPILQRPEAIVLDLCCGTGDLSLALAREGKARIIGADFAHPMLVRARAKAASLSIAGSDKTKTPGILSAAKTSTPTSALREENLSERRELGDQSSIGETSPGIFFAEADALRLPFADNSFDLVTTAFGFRNLANYEAGLREIHRILKPGGTIAILEFTEPPDTLSGKLYRVYFREILSRIGGLISGNYTAYSYLPKSVSRFFLPPELAALMTKVGYTSVAFRTWTFGTVALHTAIRAN